MNPLLMTAKLKHLTGQFRRNGLTSNELQDLNQTYLRQYHGLSKDDIVEKFMRNFNNYLQTELEEKGYWHNPHEPEQHLRDLAKVGTFAIFCYHGFVPEKHQEMLRPFLQKKLIRIFNLKSFQGFRIQFVQTKKCAHMTSIRLSWQCQMEEAQDKQVEAQKLAEKVVPQLAATSGQVTPMVIEKETVAGHDYEVVTEIRRDLRKNLRQLRRDLEKSFVENDFSGLSRHKSRHHSRKSVIPTEKSHHHKSRHRSRKNEPPIDVLIDQIEKRKAERKAREAKKRTTTEESISSELSSFNENDGIVNLHEKRKDLRPEPEVDLD